MVLMNVIQWIVSERNLEHIRISKEKPLKINAFRGFLVAGVVLLASLASTILGALY